MMILHDKLAILLRQAVHMEGSFNPNQCLYIIEEQLTKEEYELSEAFLRWVYRSELTFGQNIKEVFAEFVKYGVIDKIKV